jgi:hypothetical protein
MNKLIPILILNSLIFINSNLNSAPKWESMINVYNEIFPSLIIGVSNPLLTENLTPEKTGFSGDQAGMIAFNFIPDENNTKVNIEIESTRFIKKSTYSINLPKAGESFKVKPLINWDYEQLKSNDQVTPETITFKIQFNDQPPEIVQQRVIVRSVNDCVFAIKNDKGRFDNFNPLFGSYVNENSPLVDKILRTALDTKIVNQFGGYQGDQSKVKKEVFAIWTAFRKMGFKYSNITTPSAESDKVYCQHVRFIEDSFNSAQANCVDGSVLFASVFRKIGLQPFLVLVPGHMYVGVWLDQNRKQLLCIETTWLGENPQNNWLYNYIDSSSMVFNKSAEFATTNFWRDFPKLVAHFKQGVQADPKYQIIDIDMIRKMGVLPIK